MRHELYQGTFTYAGHTDNTIPHLKHCVKTLICSRARAFIFEQHARKHCLRLVSKAVKENRDTVILSNLRRRCVYVRWVDVLLDE